MFGLVGACAVVGSQKVGRHTFLGLLIVATFDAGRFLLVFPEQPRFELAGVHGLIGGIIFILGLYLGLSPCFSIRPLNSAEKGMNLSTTRLYRFVRNPIYLGEILWCLGWAIMYRSVIGVMLVPLWWMGLLLLIAIEEENLERSIGQPYLEYKKQVRGRIIPGLPI